MFPNFAIQRLSLALLMESPAHPTADVPLPCSPEISRVVVVGPAGYKMHVDFPRAELELLSRNHVSGDICVIFVENAKPSQADIERIILKQTPNPSLDLPAFVPEVREVCEVEASATPISNVEKLVDVLLLEPVIWPLPIECHHGHQCLKLGDGDEFIRAPS